MTISFISYMIPIIRFGFQKLYKQIPPLKQQKKHCTKDHQINCFTLRHINLLRNCWTARYRRRYTNILYMQRFMSTTCLGSTLNCVYNRLRDTRKWWRHSRRHVSAWKNDKPLSGKPRRAVSHIHGNTWGPSDVLPGVWKLFPLFPVFESRDVCLHLYPKAHFTKWNTLYRLEQIWYLEAIQIIYFLYLSVYKNIPSNLIQTPYLPAGGLRSANTSKTHALI